MSAAVSTVTTQSLTHVEATRVFNREIMPAIKALAGFALGRVSHDRADADDLMQIVALKCWRHIGSYESGTNPRAWVATIVRHEAINLHRGGRRFEALSLEDWSLDLRTAGGIDAGLADTDALDDDEAQQLAFLQTALSVLPREHKEMIRLRYNLDRRTDVGTDADGLVPIRECARVMGVPSGTVMSRTFRGRQRIALASNLALLDVLLGPIPSHRNPPCGEIVRRRNVSTNALLDNDR